MKRILIIGANVLNMQNAAGITLRSVFDQIDPQCLMGVAWGDMRADTEQGTLNIRKLHYRNFSLGQLLDNPKLKKASRRIKKAEQSYAVNTDNATKPMSGVFRAVKCLREWIALAPSRAAVAVSAEDMNALKAFSPDVIYTVGESISALDLSYRLSIALDIPIVIHFMDNWKHHIEWAENPLLKRYQKRLKQKCDLCYERSTACIAVSQGMADVYTEETGVAHNVVMNSIDTEAFHLPAKAASDEIHFVYAGGLHLGRHAALLMIGEHIDRICDETGAKASFSIYTSKENLDLHAGDFANLKHTVLHSAVPHDQIMKVYAQADILIHAESNENRNNDFFKYSVSTKMSEYLASGRTVMFFGPENIYLYDFLKDNDLAYTAASEADADRLLRIFIAGRYENLADKAYAYARDHFDVNVAVKAFCDTIEHVSIPR